MSTPRVQALVDQHGGVASVHTHPVTKFDRRTGAYVHVGWANTIVCRDGYRRTLTRAEEAVLGTPREVAS